MFRSVTLPVFAWAVMACSAVGAEPSAMSLEGNVLPLLRARCVKCHGPAKREGELNLSNARSLAQGGESGPVINRDALLASLIWRRIEADEMPPDDPLPAEERQVIKQWLAAGAVGLPRIE